jgi:hypothetical protein
MPVGITLMPHTILAIVVVGIGWLFLFVVLWALIWTYAHTRRNAV